MFCEQSAETLRERNTDSALDQELRDDIRRIDDAELLLLGNLRRLLAAADRAQPLDIGDRLLEDVTENGDRHVAAIVPIGERGELFGQVIRQNDLVGNGIGSEQAAVIGPDAAALVANVDLVEEGPENCSNTVLVAIRCALWRRAR